MITQHQKGFAPLIVILILLAIGAGGSGYYAKKKSAERRLKEASKVAMVKEDTSMRAEKMTVLLSAQNNSGQTGTARIENIEGRALIILSLSNSPEGGTAQPAHIHAGSCAVLGEVEYTLSPVVNGKSETTLQIPVGQLIAQLPLAINAHRSAIEIQTYVACGDVVTPASSAGSRENAACLAKCRDTYGGSGSAAYDACVRECGASRPGPASGARETGVSGEMSAQGSVGIGMPVPGIKDVLEKEAFDVGTEINTDETIMVQEQSAVRTFNGTILAGISAPLLDFTKADYDMAIQSGKLVVLYFYANWCPICRLEFPKMEAAFNELTVSGVVGFRVNYNDTDTDADEKELAKQFGVAYQHTKVFVKNGERILKSPEGWDKARYLKEIDSAL